MGHAPKEKRQTEIDILAERDKNTVLFDECKWTNEKVGLGVLEALIKRSSLFPYQMFITISLLKPDFQKDVPVGQMRLGMLQVSYEEFVTEM